MGNPYPANVESADGSVRLSGQVDFTDPGNQPGGASSLSVIGPFTIHYDDPGINSVVKLADLAAGTLVIAAWAFLVTEWADATNAQHDLVIAVGGPNWASFDFWQIADIALDQPFEVGSAAVGHSDFIRSALTSAASGSFNASQMNVGYVGPDPGALVVAVTDGAPATQGEANVYALIHVPA